MLCSQVNVGAVWSVELEIPGVQDANKSSDCAWAFWFLADGPQLELRPYWNGEHTAMSQELDVCSSLPPAIVVVPAQAGAFLTPRR